MANEFEMSQLTTEDFQDYWGQFLRFYADETGKNFSKKIPISYLDKVLRDEIIEKLKDRLTYLLMKYSILFVFVFLSYLFI